MRRRSVGFDINCEALEGLFWIPIQKSPELIGQVSKKVYSKTYGKIHKKANSRGFE